MKNYHPREGSLPDKVIGTLENSPPGTQLNNAQICRDFGVTSSAVRNLLLAAVEHGALVVSEVEGKRAYSLGPGNGTSAAAAKTPASARMSLHPPAEDVAADPVTTEGAPQFALWCDGTLHLHGITPREDGVIELTLPDAARLARLLHGFTFEQ